MRSRLLTSSAITAASIGLVPALASAASLFDTLAVVNTFLNALIGLFITLAIVVFFWGLIKYLWSGGEDKAAGLQTMMYGVIAIFVMVSIWGIIRLLQNTFNVQSTDPIIPKGIQINNF
jgi:hypothetical protein